VDWRAALRAQLVRHEGLRDKPYVDTTGHLTIGVGRNLYDRGISPDEAMYLMENDIEDAEDTARGLVFNFEGLSAVRKQALVNLAFNLGHQRMSQFKKMLGALEHEDFKAAASHLLDSKYAKQVKGRAHELARMLERGV